MSAPLPGQHTKEVLREHGIPDKEIAALIFIVGICEEVESEQILLAGRNYLYITPEEMFPPLKISREIRHCVDGTKECFDGDFIEDVEHSTRPVECSKMMGDLGAVNNIAVRNE